MRGCSGALLRPAHLTRRLSFRLADQFLSGISHGKLAAFLPPLKLLPSRTKVCLRRSVGETQYNRNFLLLHVLRSGMISSGAALQRDGPLRGRFDLSS